MRLRSSRIWEDFDREVRQLPFYRISFARAVTQHRLVDPRQNDSVALHHECLANPEPERPICRRLADCFGSGARIQAAKSCRSRTFLAVRQLPCTQQPDSEGWLKVSEGR